MLQREICRVHDDTIEQYAMGGLKKNNLARFEQHLLICETCQKGVIAADSFVATMRSALREVEQATLWSDRRSEPRQACKGAVEVRIRGTRRLVPGRATDMSQSGFGLTVGVQMPTGARIVLATGGKQYTGEIAWCAAQGLVYRIGVRLAA